MNAIILAAGLGSRLRPITDTIPKSLIHVNGKPIIETQIEYLHEIGIKDITIVTGYLYGEFEYLKDKYNLSLVNNKYYDKYNNIYTMSLVIDKMSDTYVLDADVFMTRNFLVKDINESTYFSGTKNAVGEWELRCNDNKVTEITSSNGVALIMSGVSYWAANDTNYIKEKLLNKISNNKNWVSLYWDDIIKENIENIDIRVVKISSNDWFEIDTIEEYQAILEKYPNKY